MINVTEEQTLIITHDLPQNAAGNNIVSICCLSHHNASHGKNIWNKLYLYSTIVYEDYMYL